MHDTPAAASATRGRMPLRPLVLLLALAGAAAAVGLLLAPPGGDARPAEPAAHAASGAGAGPRPSPQQPAPAADAPGSAVPTAGGPADAAGRRPAPRPTPADPPRTEATERLLERARTEPAFATVLAEVLAVERRLSGWSPDDLSPRYEAEAVRLCVLRPDERLGMRRHRVLQVRNDPARTRPRHGEAAPLGLLSPGDVREVVLHRMAPRSEAIELVWAGPAQPAPYDDVTAAMPKELFAALGRGASIFRGRVRSLSSRPTEPARRRLGFPPTIAVVEVEVLATVHTGHGLQPGVVARLDVLPPIPALAAPHLEPFDWNLPATVDPQELAAGALRWFAVDRSWRSLAVLQALP